MKNQLPESLQQLVEYGIHDYDINSNALSQSTATHTPSV
jgi:hypothetical protein